MPMTIDELFSRMSQLKIAVAGDVMLDTYWWGKVDRISPEAPVPVVSVEHKEQRIGGAGNVALNTVALGAATSIFSVVGRDEEGKQLIELLQQQGIDTKYILRSGSRITTTKTRVIARNQQMLRLDAELTTDISYEDQEKVVSEFAAFAKNNKPDVLIFEDYNKGVLTPRVIEEMISICKEHGIITTVDPKRKNFFLYKQVDIFKPNLKEVKDALNLLLEDVNAEVLDGIHQQLAEVLHQQTSFITLSDKGVYYNTNGIGVIIPSHLRSIADVSGAGDTVIATASAVYAAGRDMALAAEVANIAGGLVCEQVGTVAIDKEKLQQECSLLLNNQLVQ